MTEAGLAGVLRQIAEVKARLGRELVILAHHYQRPEIVGAADFVGDSYALSQQAAASSASHIVFCGVHFMAEAARILASPGQRVFMPEPRAGCPMAEMADADDAALALRQIRAAVAPRKVVPVTYINSTAAVKALVGEAGGITCTSANSRKALEWARRQGEVIFFLPDEHLGSHTARELGLEPIVRWNPHAGEGGVEGDGLARAAVVVWSGYCHVHTLFRAEMVAAARARYAGCRVVVHPECEAAVVAAADGAGSTSFLVDEVARAGPGATVVVGTEVSLVRRLATEFADRVVVPLAPSLCPNMYSTTAAKLARLLGSFDPASEVRVAPEVVAGARLALDRMMRL